MTSKNMLNYRGFKVRIFNRNPREEFDNIGTLALYKGVRCENGKIAKGDEVIEKKGKKGFSEHLIAKYELSEKISLNGISPESDLYWEKVYSWFSENITAGQIEFNSEIVGYIYTERKKMLDEKGNIMQKQEQHNCLRTEVEDFIYYLDGYSYGFEILDSRGNESELESFWGFCQPSVTETELVDMAKRLIDEYLEDIPEK